MPAFSLASSTTVREGRKCWLLALCPRTHQSVTTAHNTAHSAGCEVRTERSSVDCHNPSLYNQVKRIQLMLKGSKYFKKSYQSLKIVFLTILWDFWAGHYLEVQTFYHIVVEDSTGQRIANTSKYLKPDKTQAGLFSTCISKLRTTWMLLASMCTVGIPWNWFQMTVQISHLVTVLIYTTDLLYSDQCDGTLRRIYAEVTSI